MALRFLDFAQTLPRWTEGIKTFIMLSESQFNLDLNNIILGVSFQHYKGCDGVTGIIYLIEYGNTRNVSWG